MSDHIFVRRARQFAHECHQDIVHPSGVSMLDGFLPAVVELLSDNGYAKDPTMLSAAWLYDILNGSFDKTDAQGRLNTIYDELPQRCGDLVRAMSNENLYLDHASRPSINGIFERVCEVPGAPDLMIATQIIDVLASTARRPERVDFLAKLHPSFEHFIRPRVSEGLWLLLEQAFPEGKIVRRPTNAVLIATGDS